MLRGPEDWTGQAVGLVQYGYEADGYVLAPQEPS
jgi:hypothetical protein